MSIELKFGKYKGYTLEQVADDGEDGIGYLKWLLENTDPNDRKYGPQNRNLIEGIEGILGLRKTTRDAAPAPSRPATRGSGSSPQTKTTGSTATGELLKGILETLKSIEKILANPGRVHIQKEELRPEQDLPETFGGGEIDEVPFP